MPKNRDFSRQMPEPDPNTFNAESDHQEHRRIILNEDPHQRLDYYLKGHFPGLSRSKLQKLINSGDVLLNGKAPKASAAVRQGDIIDINVPPPEIKTIQPEPIPIDILYEDEYMIVVNKQQNLVVHPARSHKTGTLLNGMAHYFRKERTNGIEALSNVGVEEFRPGIVHRLDKDTTGVIVLAKTETAHYKIAQQFEKRQTQKYYLAITHGEMTPPGGAIDAPIGKHPQIAEAMAVRRDSHARESTSLYRVREVFEGYTLVEVELKTGRTHQIRVHLMYEGFPIIGDIIYGGDYIGSPELESPANNLPAMRPSETYARTKVDGEKIYAQTDLRNDIFMRRPALHAGLLEMFHPVSGEKMRFVAPLHDDMKTMIQALRTNNAKSGLLKNKGVELDLDYLINTPRDLRIR